MPSVLKQMLAKLNRQLLCNGKIWVLVRSKCLPDLWPAVVWKSGVKSQRSPCQLNSIYGLIILTGEPPIQCLLPFCILGIITTGLYMVCKGCVSIRQKVLYFCLYRRNTNGIKHEQNIAKKCDMTVIWTSWWDGLFHWDRETVFNTTGIHPSHFKIDLVCSVWQFVLTEMIYSGIMLYTFTWILTSV